jgi:hypothetical protein
MAEFAWKLCPKKEKKDCHSPEAVLESNADCFKSVIAEPREGVFQS